MLVSNSIFQYSYPSVVPSSNSLLLNKKTNYVRREHNNSNNNRILQTKTTMQCGMLNSNSVYERHTKKKSKSFCSRDTFESSVKSEDSLSKEEKTAIIKKENEEEPTVWQGAKIKPLVICIALGLAIRFLVPVPNGVSIQAWTVLAIFLSTITGLVLEPLPTGATAFLALTTTVLTKALTFGQATTAMTSEVIWLIVVSFFFAKGFEITGLGERIALCFVKVLGKSTLGLSFGLNAAELVVSPAMPSTTARAGGIFMPVITSIAKNVDSLPGDESRLKLGAYLAHSQFQTSSHSSALFLTGAAQNLLCLKLATDIIGNIPNIFVTWMVGAALPAAIGLIMTPLIMYKVIPPQIKDTPNAPKEASRQLEKMGPMSREEIIMASTMFFAVTLWIFGDAIGVPPVLAAMIGLCILLGTGVLTWKQCLEHSPAWDTFFWFAVLISLSGALNSMGLISVLSTKVAGVLASINIGWVPICLALNFIYFIAHYLFASQTAHVGALMTAFLTLMISANVPPLIAAMSLSYTQNLFGSITQFASGQAAVYYGAGFFTLNEIFKVGAIFGAFNILVWGIFGILWWKVLGWW